MYVRFVFVANAYYETNFSSKAELSTGKIYVWMNDATCFTFSIFISFIFIRSRCKDQEVELNSLRQKLLKLSGLVDSQKDRIEALTNDLK